jgi:hypothetical protein
MSNNTEYAVYGWFKFEEPKLRKDAHTIFRLTNNIPNSNFDYMGDSTISLYIIGDQLVFTSYNLDNDMIEEDNPRIDIPFELENDLGEWIFFYFGYERLTKTYSAYVRFGDRVETETSNLVHFNPYYV